MNSIIIGYPLPQKTIYISEGNKTLHWTVKLLTTFSEKYIQGLLNDLDNQDKYSRASALETLSDIVIDNRELLQELVPHFKRKLKDTSPLVQMTAIEALGKVGKRFPDLITGTIPQLSEFLKVQDQYLREGALELIGEIGAKDPQVVRDIIPTIMTLMEADEPDIREKATDTIAKTLSNDDTLLFDDLKKFTSVLLNNKLDLRRRVLPIVAQKFVDLLVHDNNPTRTQTMILIESLSDKDLGIIREIVPLLIKKLADQNVASITAQNLIDLLPLIRKAIQEHI